MDRSYDIIICILVGTNLGMETERDSKSDKEDDKESKSQNDNNSSENDDSQEDNSQGGSNTLTDEELQDMLDSDSVAPSENLSNDDGSDSVELSDRQKKMLDNHFKKQEKFLDGDVQKTKLNKKESKINFEISLSGKQR